MYLSLAASYSVLVLMKHLFATLAPVFAIYLLLTHCKISSISIRRPSSVVLFVFRLLQLVVVAGCSLLAAFFPFLLAPVPPNATSICIQLPAGLVPDQWWLCADGFWQILTRLFPFGRGLVHAYWAPNVWALYLLADKILSFLARRFGLPIPTFSSTQTAMAVSSSSGIVGEYALSHLPPVGPGTSMALVLLAILPALASLFARPRLAQERGSTSLIRAVQFSALSSFMLGYHVHEKAILVALLPATLLLSTRKKDVSPGPPSSPEQLQNIMYLQCAAGGIVGLLPLFTGLQELLLKGFICFAFLVTAHVLLAPACGLFYSRLNMFTIAGMFVVYVYGDMLHPLLFWSSSTGEVTLPFLPRIVYSATCALVLAHAWFLSVSLPTPHRSATPTPL
jgi:alpha-1,3-glucosyltransferase